jgi:hypothetical protein
MEELLSPFENSMGSAEECIISVPVIRIKVLNDLIDQVWPLCWEV